MSESMVYAADVATLQEVWTSIVQKWIGPAVFIIIGACSLKFLFSRQWTQFVAFLALGIIVAAIIYAAPAMFSQNSTLVRGVGDVAKQIN